MKTYEAPWSTSLILTSLVTTLICVGIAGTLVWSSHGLAWGATVPLAIVCGGALFAIRGYTVTPDAILIHRLFWTTRLPRAGLESAQFDPEAMCGGIRTFGNGGLFSFTGLFWNKILGTYRAFVTDPRRTVVLYFPARTIVVSPSEPRDFVRELNAAGYE